MYIYLYPALISIDRGSVYGSANPDLRGVALSRFD
jgi:hypothetical protein